MINKRYIRQSILPEIGETGQEELEKSHVTIIGCGGLGSIAAPYLAGAGIGKITLIDGDITDISNLHRQVLFSDKNTGKSKAKLLANHLSALNPDIDVNYMDTMLHKNNIHSLLENTHLVLECTDTILTKYLVNDYCHIHSIPLIYGAIHKYDGYVSFFENTSKNSIHLRDVFPEPDTKIPNCSEVGVMGPIAGLIGLLQANEALKYFTRAGENLVGKLLSYNVLNNEQLTLSLRKVYHTDMASVFENNSYSHITCKIYGITSEELLQNRREYEVVSILEHEENTPFDKETLHMPLSQFDFENWKPDMSKRYVFHCKSGKRSSSLVSKLAESGKIGNFYYLIQD